MVGLSLVGLMSVWTGHYLGGFAGPSQPNLGRPASQIARCNHRRRIKTESKAKVVASIWGTEFIQFLTALAIVYYGDFEE